MKLTVKYGEMVSSREFHKGILLWEALCEMGIFLERPCGGRGVCGKCEVLANGEKVRACSTNLEEDMVVEGVTFSKEMRVLTEGKNNFPTPSMQIQGGYGLAVDIGTTTIAAYLYQFPQGELIRTWGMENPQNIYGADVVTRMGYALKGGGDALQKCLTDCIQGIVGDLPVERYVITGNTTMLHFFTGRSVEGLSCAPYLPESLFGHWEGKWYLPRCISAFVGADITCGVLASGMLEKKAALLVDIGTNGEMVLYRGGRLLCCSAAAGPAFEGAEISQGMPAWNGAIHKVWLEGNCVRYSTIGEDVPRGICGSGLVDIIAVMLELAIIDDTGYLENAYEIPGSGVFITPEDVRQVQLAKAAIRAGMETLLHEGGCSYDELECFYIAGGFGSYIDKSSAAKIGLIPGELTGKSCVMGNAAGMGASMILQDGTYMEKAERIAESAETVQLADSSYFAEKYVKYMMFECE